MALDLPSYLLGKSKGGGGGTSDYSDLTNKPSINGVTLVGEKTSDDLGLETIQFSTMPTASADNLGKVVQYIGTSAGSYTNGYFYICVSDGQSTPTYSWSNINVQSSESPVGDLFIANYKDMQSTSANYQAVKDKFSYMINRYKGGSFIFLYNHNTSTQAGPAYLIRCDISSQLATNYEVCLPYRYDGNADSIMQIWLPTGSVVNNEYVVSGFSSQWKYPAPKYLAYNNSSSYTVSSDYIPAHKLYVDDRLESIAPAYSTSSTYAIGDYVTYKGKFYKCNTAINTAEAWTAGHWTETTVMAELALFNTTITQRLSALTSLPISDVQVVNSLPQQEQNGTLYLVEDE